MRKEQAPPEDEFEPFLRDSYVVPVPFLVWVAIVRTWRAVRRRLAGP